MKLHRIVVRNYRGIADREVILPEHGVTILEGDNEVGKTSLAEAVDLLIDYQDSSTHRRIKAVVPVGRDEGPEVEVELTTGPYRLIYAKRWQKQRFTTLRVLAPRPEQLAGREAHERVERILDETLDRALWHAVRLEQGADFGPTGFLLPSLTRALDRTAGGDRGTDHDDSVWARIADERLRYWTPTGLARVERSKRAAALDVARGAVADVERRIRELDAETDEFTRLSQLVPDLRQRVVDTDATLATQHAAAGAVVARRAEVRDLRTHRDRAAAEHDRWADAVDRRSELLATSHRSELVHAERGTELEQLAPQLVQLDARHVALEAQLRVARAALEDAEAVHRRALDEHDLLRDQLERDDLAGQRDRALDAQDRHRVASARIESIRIDRALLERIEAASFDVARAEAALEGGVVVVELRAASDLAVTVDGKRCETSSASDTPRLRTWTVTDSLDLGLGLDLDPGPGLAGRDIASIHVRASADVRALAERAELARAALATICAEAGVVDVADARRLIAVGQDAARVLGEATRDIERDLRGLTLDAIIAKIDRLTHRLATVPNAIAPGGAIPFPFDIDLDAARTRVHDSEAHVSALRLAQGRLEHDIAEASAARHEVALEHATRRARLEQAHAAASQARESLAAARAERADNFLDEAFAMAHADLESAEKRLREATRDLAERDPDTVDELLANADSARRRARAELDANQTQREALRVRLEVLGEHGVAHELDTARTAEVHLTREQERIEARAHAADLLYRAFEQRRAEAHQRYLAPFRTRLEQLGRIVFGPTLSIELDDQLRIARRTLDGITVEFDQLSGGAREQLGILTRLASAMIVADDGGVPVLFDDALGWTDPSRLERMGAAIAMAGRTCQIVVLTCTPGRYRGVGDATVIRLADCAAS
jgi:hypothetical protein